MNSQDLNSGIPEVKKPILATLMIDLLTQESWSLYASSIRSCVWQ
jgi:hypothetical protein